MTAPEIRGVEVSRRHRRWHITCPACGHVHTVDQRVGDDGPFTVTCTRVPRPSWLVDSWERVP